MESSASKPEANASGNAASKTERMQYIDQDNMNMNEL